MGLYEALLSMSLLRFGMGTILAKFHMCGIMLVLIAVFNMLVRNASPRGAMCLRMTGYEYCILYVFIEFFCNEFILIKT